MFLFNTKNTALITMQIISMKNNFKTKEKAKIRV